MIDSANILAKTHNMDEVRQKLTSECDILELSASIANEARNGELLSFVNDIVAKTGYLDDVTISFSARYSSITQCPCNIRIKSKLCNWKIFISFHENDNTMYAIAYIEGLDCMDISSKARGLGNHMIAAVAILSRVIDSLDSLDDLLNSSSFNSYNNDIARYLNAQSKIKEHDEQLYNEQIANIIKSFRPGMKIKTGNYEKARECVITKVCNKLLYVDNYRPYFFDVSKKTIEKNIAARNIANQDWSIVDAKG